MYSPRNLIPRGSSTLNARSKTIGASKCACLKFGSAWAPKKMALVPFSIRESKWGVFRASPLEGSEPRSLPITGLVGHTSRVALEVTRRCGLASASHLPTGPGLPFASVLRGKPFPSSHYFLARWLCFCNSIHLVRTPRT